MATWAPILVSILSVVGAIAAAAFARSQALQVTKTQATASPYEALAERVVTLETKVGVLEKEKDDDREWIRAMLAWIRLHYPDAAHPQPPQWWNEYYREM